MFFFFCGCKNMELTNEMKWVMIIHTKRTFTGSPRVVLMYLSLLNYLLAIHIYASLANIAMEGPRAASCTPYAHYVGVCTTTIPEGGTEGGGDGGWSMEREQGARRFKLKLKHQPGTADLPQNY